MSEAVFGFIGVIVGGIITTLASIGVEVVRARGTSTLDREKRADDRRIGRDVFQRETLLGIQDAANAVAHDAYEVIRSYEAGAPVPAGLRDALTANRMRLNTLQSRAADDEIRRLADTLINGTTADELKKSAKAAKTGEPANTTVLLVQNCGELVRESFVREAAS